MLQLESMRAVNATLERIKTELDEGNVEEPEELYKLTKEASLAVLDIQMKLDLKNVGGEKKKGCNQDENKCPYCATSLLGPWSFYDSCPYCGKWNDDKPEANSEVHNDG